jgi:carbonic anhydrase
MAQVDADALRQRMIDSGVPEGAIAALKPGLSEWLGGFHDPLGNVERVVTMLRDNPLIPPTVPVHGMIFDPSHGTLQLLVDGYAAVG